MWQIGWFYFSSLYIHTVADISTFNCLDKWYILIYPFIFPVTCFLVSIFWYFGSDFPEVCWLKSLDHESELAQETVWRRGGEKSLPTPMLSQCTDVYMRQQVKQKLSTINHLKTCYFNVISLRDMSVAILFSLGLFTTVPCFTPPRRIANWGLFEQSGPVKARLNWCAWYSTTFDNATVT